MLFICTCVFHFAARCRHNQIYQHVQIDRYRDICKISEESLYLDITVVKFDHERKNIAR